MPDLTKKQVEKIVADYDDLLARAFQVISASPHYASADTDDLPYLTLDKDDVVLSWRAYEFDYYGGGCNTTETTRFPLDVLLLTEAELKAMQAKVEAAEKEREARLRAAQEAVARDRQEAMERAVYAQLRAKFEKL